MLNKIDRRDFDKVVEMNLNHFVKFAFFKIGNIQDAEDIVYDAILKVLEKRIHSLSQIQLRAYIFKTIYNLCQDYFRQTKECVSIDNISIVDINGALDTQEDYNRINSILNSERFRLTV